MQHALGAKRVALVAEDHPTYIERVTALLDGWGVECVRAVDGAAAIAQITAGTPLDLLVTDLDMPHHTGWDVIEAWLAAGRPPQTVIMVTGEADSLDVQERCAAGGIRLIHKVAIMAQLERAVQDVLRYLDA